MKIFKVWITVSYFTGSFILRRTTNQNMEISEWYRWYEIQKVYWRSDRLAYWLLSHLRAGMIWIFKFIYFYLISQIQNTQESCAVTVF